MGEAPDAGRAELICLPILLPNLLLLIAPGFRAENGDTISGTNKISATWVALIF